MITKICQGCNETYEHDDPHPLLAQEYAEMALYCGHHFTHAGWRQVTAAGKERAAALVKGSDQQVKS